MTEKIRNTAHQLPLGFEPCNYMGVEDFMVSDCNRQAFTMIESWPNWLSSGLFIYGPKGCGKSHLAHLFIDRVRRNGKNISGTTIIKAEQINMRNVAKLAKENHSIVIEDVFPRNNDEALFHLFNLFNEEGKYMLWTSEKPVNLMHFKLRDLQTRLNMLPAAAISDPDDLMLQMLVVKLFNDRQIMIGQDILNYILNNSCRSFAYICDLVSRIDELSLSRRSSVNYDIVKTAFRQLKDAETNEPDLFDEY